MNTLTITSVEPFSGKTALCLGLGLRLKTRGLKMGYLKPLSLQLWRSGQAAEPPAADEDALFATEILDSGQEPLAASPVTLTAERLAQRLAQKHPEDLLSQVQAALSGASAGRDMVLIEGGSSLREGYVMGLSTAVVARALNSRVLALVKYHNEMQALDDALAMRNRLGDLLCGIVLNRVASEAMPFARDIATPFLARQGIPVFGILPDVRSLSALTVGEIVSLMKAEVLTRYLRTQTLVENLVVGAMTAETALTRFRLYSHKAVITGGDRTDIQLAALETSTSCLILTGGLRPSPLVVKQAEEFGVAVLLVAENTLETVGKLENVVGKTRLAQTHKLKLFRNLLEERFDFENFSAATDFAW